MSPVLDQIQEKVYERPIPYPPVLGHSGFNRELLVVGHVEMNRAVVTEAMIM